MATAVYWIVYINVRWNMYIALSAAEVMHHITRNGMTLVTGETADVDLCSSCLSEYLFFHDLKGEGNLRAL
jgi:hypothetical protein